MIWLVALFCFVVGLVLGWHGRARLGAPENEVADALTAALQVPELPRPKGRYEVHTEDKFMSGDAAQASAYIEECRALGVSGTLRLDGKLVKEF